MHPEKTRDRIIRVAQELMQRLGYVGTSVETICQAAGVTKGAFFHHFESKEALAVAALKQFSDEVTAKMGSAEFTTREDPLDRLCGYIDLMRDLVDDSKIAKGCLLALFTLERATSEEPFCAICTESFKGWETFTTQIIDEAAQAYPPTVPVPSVELAKALISMVEGSLLLYRAHGDRTLYRDNIEHFRRYLTFVFGEPRSHRQPAVNA